MSDYIPFALQAEFMLRLPTKSLLQFRSVSKEWKSLIDSSQFVIDYSVNHTHQHHLLARYLEDRELVIGEYFVSVVDDETLSENKCFLPAPIHQFGEVTMLGGSQGLFFVYIRHIDNLYTAFLWNPSIRKSVAVDVADFPVVIGFGACPHTSDPKLVKITGAYGVRGKTPWKVEVYTLSSRAWRSIPTINQPRNSINLDRDQIAIDNIMYWLARTTRSMFDTIVSFDMTSEKFMEISLPDTIVRGRNYVQICKLKESLVVVEMLEEAGKQVCVVWRMEHDVLNLFTKLFTINTPEGARLCKMLGFRQNNEAIFAMVIDFNAHDVFVHRVHSECMICTCFSGNGFLYHVRPYMETLLLLDQ